MQCWTANDWMLTSADWDRSNQITIISAQKCFIPRYQGKLIVFLQQSVTLQNESCIPICHTLKQLNFLAVKICIIVWKTTIYKENWRCTLLKVAKGRKIIKVMSLFFAQHGEHSCKPRCRCLDFVFTAIDQHTVEELASCKTRQSKDFQRRRQTISPAQSHFIINCIRLLTCCSPCKLIMAACCIISVCFLISHHSALVNFITLL